MPVMSISTVRITIVAILSVISRLLSIVDGLTYDVSLWSCPVVAREDRIAVFEDVHIDECVERCIARPQCASLAFSRHVTVCELYRTDVTLLTNDVNVKSRGVRCVAINRANIHVDPGEVNSHCTQAGNSIHVMHSNGCNE